MAESLDKLIRQVLGAAEPDPRFARFAAFDGGLKAGISIHKIDGTVSLIVTVDDENFRVRLMPVEVFEPTMLDWRFDGSVHVSWFRKWEHVMGRAPMLCPVAEEKRE